MGRLTIPSEYRLSNRYTLGRAYFPILILEESVDDDFVTRTQKKREGF